MAIDNTPPRLKLIATIAVITIITLISLDFVFKSYFAMMTDEAQSQKLAPTRDRDEQQRAEQVALTNAALPIDQAMAQLARGARPEVVAPQASDDLTAMTGWSKLPKPAPTPAPKAEPSPAVAGDGGVTLAADGGAALPVDAGAAPAADGGAGGARPDGGAHGLHH